MFHLNAFLFFPQAEIRSQGMRQKERERQKEGVCVCVCVCVEGGGQMEPEEISLQMIHPIFHSLLLSASVALCVRTPPLPLSVSRCV